MDTSEGAAHTGRPHTMISHHGDSDASLLAAWEVHRRTGRLLWAFVREQEGRATYGVEGWEYLKGLRRRRRALAEMGLSVQQDPWVRGVG